jgi:hypothetical protein
MKKILSYASILLLIAAGAACKKEKQEPVVNSISPGGNLLINQYFSIDHDTVLSKNDFDAGALFTGPNAIDYLSVDSVYMNKTLLLMSSKGLAGYYQAPVKSANSWAWHVKGNSLVPSFDYTNTMRLPSFTEFASLPDSIYRSHDFVISLKGLTNATFASIQINGGTNPVSKTFSITPGMTSIQIPIKDLAGLTQADVLVEIVFQNGHVQEIGDRAYTFQNSILISKRMKIN